MKRVLAFGFCLILLLQFSGCSIPSTTGLLGKYKATNLNIFLLGKVDSELNFTGQTELIMSISACDFKCTYTLADGKLNITPVSIDSLPGPLRDLLKDQIKGDVSEDTKLITLYLTDLGLKSTEYKKY